MSETFEELYESAPCGLFSLTMDGDFTHVNATLATLLGAPAAELIGRPFVSFLDAGAQIFYETHYLPALRLGGEIREVSLNLKRVDGSVLPALLNSTLARDGSGAPAFIRTALFDASGRADYEHELVRARRLAEASEVRVRVLQEASTTFGQSQTPTDLADALFTAAKSAFGATHTAVLLRREGGYEVVAGHHPLLEFLPPEVLSAPVAVEMNRLIALETRKQIRAELPGIVDAMVSSRLTSMSSMPLFGESEPLGILACFYSRSREFDDAYRQLQQALASQASQALERIQLTRELEASATHDLLTGLANRVLLQERMDEALAGSARDGHPLAVVFLDLDGFKAVNDNLGHAAGDAVLREVATRLRAEVRATDVVGRYGGDEFVIICPSADAVEAGTVAGRLLGAVALPFQHIPSEFAISASIGISVLGPWTSTADSLFNAADAAMYASKSAGKGRITVAGARPVGR